MREWTDLEKNLGGWRELAKEGLWEAISFSIRDSISNSLLPLPQDNFLYAPMNILVVTLLKLTGFSDHYWLNRKSDDIFFFSLGPFSKCDGIVCFSPLINDVSDNSM